MAIHWQVKFKSLRAETDYTVNVYDDNYSGSPVVLKGAAEPFVTDEDDDDDVFLPVRTQSGYLRIVDDGYAADGVTPFDWKSFIPSTDKNRPVTLTNGAGTVLWAGCMQAMDFGSTLYGNPQEREFPVQCALAVTGCTDITNSQASLRNFAYLLKCIVDSIPSEVRPSAFYVQGGSVGQQLLLKLIDWQLFVELDDDFNRHSKYTCLECLEEMCTFFGWTARLSGRTMYMTGVDDTTYPGLFYMTYDQLSTMAGGTAAGNTSSNYTSTTLTGDIFASDDNKETLVRGCNRVTVSVDADEADSELVKAFPDKTWRQLYNDGATRTLTFFSEAFLVGSCSNGATFGVYQTAKRNKDQWDVSNLPDIYIPSSYTSGQRFVTLQTVQRHVYSGKWLYLKCDIYKNREKFSDNDEDHPYGNKTMYMRLGIGDTRETARWYDGSNWSNTETMFPVFIGGREDVLAHATSKNASIIRYGIRPDGSCRGNIFIDFLGSDDFTQDEGLDMHITGFSLEYEDDWSWKTDGLQSQRKYHAGNNNTVEEDKDVDCLFATYNYLKYGYALLYNPTYTLFYGGGFYADGVTVRPEQHLADRIASYWATSKRMLELSLRSNAVADITPRYRVTVDGTTTYPIAISHDWRDDVLRIKTIQI